MAKFRIANIMRFSVAGFEFRNHELHVPDDHPGLERLRKRLKTLPESIRNQITEIVERDAEGRLIGGTEQMPVANRGITEAPVRPLPSNTRNLPPNPEANRLPSGAERSKDMLKDPTQKSISPSADVVIPSTLPSPEAPQPDPQNLLVSTGQGEAADQIALAQGIRQGENQAENSASPPEATPAGDLLKEPNPPPGSNRSVSPALKIKV